MRVFFYFFLLCVVGCGREEIFALKAEDVRSIEVIPDIEQDYRWRKLKEYPKSKKTSDPHIIQEILDSLKSVGKPTPHKCTHLAEMILVKKNGETVKLFLLPGHEDSYYEFETRQAAHRVDRAKFLRAMDHLGAEWLPHTCN